jgi:hypothetical protein
VLEKEEQGLLAFLQASKLQPEQITGPLTEEQKTDSSGGQMDI